MSRRVLLLAAPALLARPARAGAAPLRLEPAVDDMVALTGSGIRRPLLLPAQGARMLPGLECGREALAVVRFSVEQGGAGLDWAAIAMALEGGVALLALEPVAWRDAGGARMGSRLAAGGDRMRVQCQRDTAVPQSPTLWRREAWTDYLAWVPPCGLVDAPVRPPLPGTQQHAVAQWRRRAAELVAGGPVALTPGVLAAAGLQAASFSLVVSATPLMRQPSGPRIIV